MKKQTSVKVQKSGSEFSAAHFLADMGKCERMHGHNYHVSVRAGGPQDARGVVMDFNLLAPAIARVCARLDHMVLLAGNSPRMKIGEKDGAWEIRFGQKLYLLPKEDCVMLPLESTTAENLASHILDELLAELGEAAGRLSWMELGVGEGGGQMAFQRVELGGGEEG